MAKNTTFKNTPLWDSSLPLDSRLDYLLEQLTLEEKFQCLGTGCPAIERLGIEEFYVGGEGAHGVQARHDQSFDKGEPQPTTVLPNPVGMSATWDVELIKEAGRVVGNEARAVYSKEKKGGLCLWAPTVDMERDPRWGRTEEAYGEDPYLAGKMASAYVQGMRGEDPFYIRCGATLKHFYANNVEEGRVWKSSSIDPRNKYEYYLEPFRRAVEEGGAEAIMAAYNEINGVPCLLNDEMQHIAKEQWGVHHIVCDGGDMKQTVEFHKYFETHTETVAAALKAGLDCFTDELEDVVSGAREAYECGMISMEDIDRALRCHFGTLIRLGLFDAAGENPYGNIGEEELNTGQNQKISYELAKESVVMLKNDPIGKEGPLLPLFSGNGRKGRPGDNKLAVIGPLADVWYMDWYSGIPPYHVTPLEGLRRYFSSGSSDGNNTCGVSDLKYLSGLPLVKLACGDMFLGVLDDGRTIGLVMPERAEIFEITLWDKKQVTLRSKSTGLLLMTEDGTEEDGSYRQGIVTASKEEAFGWFVKEAFHITWEGESFIGALREEKELCLTAWNDALLFVDGQGRLRVAEPEGFVENGVPQRDKKYRSMPKLRPILVEDGMDMAVSLAKESDTVVLMAGAHPIVSCKEENDRQDIELTLYQRELIQAVYEANPRVVLALITSIPFGIAWEKEHIPAIVTMASGSMELGNALADVLMGEAAPSGRLNMTWYRNVENLPDIDDYDIIQGERTYLYYKGEVLYPFGHGLTYSPVNYSGLHVGLCGHAALEVALEISNEGRYQTDEVVQIYVSKKNSVVKRPIRQLKAFKRIKELQPGQKRNVRFEIPVEDLRYYDVVSGEMLLEPGEYEIQAGASSQDIRLRESIVLEGTVRGVRNGLDWNPADHYDVSEHAVLREGHGGYSCARTVGRDMKLVYEDVFLREPPEELVLDAEMTEGAEIEVYLDDVLVGRHVWMHDGSAEKSVPSVEETGREDTFRECTVPMAQAAAFADEKRHRLMLICHGAVKICRWRFVQG